MPYDRKKKEEEDIEGLYRGKDLSQTASNFFDRMSKRPEVEPKEDPYAPEKRRFSRITEFMRRIK